MKKGLRRVYALLWREVKIANSLYDILSTILVVILYVFGFALTMSNALSRTIFYKGLEIPYILFMSTGVVGLGTFMVGFNRGFAISRLDNASGILSLFFVSNLKPIEYLVARSFNFTLTLLIEYSLIIVFNYLLTGYLPSLSMLLAGLVLIAIYTWIWTCMGVSLGLRIKSEYTRDLVFLFVGTPLMLTSTAYYPREAMPYILKYVSYFNPVTYAIDILRDTYLSLQPQIIEIIASIVLLILFSLIAVKLLRNYSYK